MVRDAPAVRARHGRTSRAAWLRRQLRRVAGVVRHPLKLKRLPATFAAWQSRDRTGAAARIELRPRPRVANEIRVLLYCPSNLNVIDGSSIWVHSTAEALHTDPRVHITIPLRAPERRDVVTRLLRRLERVELVDPRTMGRTSGRGLGDEEALDVIEEIDAVRNFDVILLREYRVCLPAADRARFRGRLWTAYVLAPELDTSSGEYVDGMTRIALASEHVIVQSEEMRALLDRLVPAAVGKTLLLPPAIPVESAEMADPDVPVRRLIYTGKFSEFYPVPRMVDFFGELRREWPELEFHVAGDKFHDSKEDPAYAERLRELLSSTDGVVWHGGVARDDVAALLAQGGVALSLWEWRYGPEMNDLVISTKLLDYCAARLPVVLNRTTAQESLLGADYPLFVTAVDEALPVIRRVLADPLLYREAALRTWQASRRYTYPQVYAGIAPALARGTAVKRGQGTDPQSATVTAEQPELQALQR